jgi:hypothetical protein
MPLVALNQLLKKLAPTMSRSANVPKPQRDRIN